MALVALVSVIGLLAPSKALAQGSRTPAAPSAATVEDSRGNKYKMHSFLGLPVEGQPDAGASLYPNKPLTDAIVFEEVIAGAKFLRVMLPKQAFGGDGKLYLEIVLQ